MLEIMVILSLIFYLISSIVLWIYLFNKKSILKKIGFSILGLGYISQLAYIGIRDIKEKTFYISSHTDIPFFLAFILMTIFYFFVVLYKEKIKELSSFVSTINSILVALTLPYIHYTEKIYLKNIWFHMHIIFATLSLALIVFSSILAIVYLFLERDLKRKNLNSFFISKLSISITTIQSLLNKLNILIFISLTISLISSSIWASVYRKLVFLYEPKEIGLIFLLIYYGVLVHLGLFLPQRKSLQIKGLILGSIIAITLFILTKH